jgi:RIO kinase 1
MEEALQEALDAGWISEVRYVVKSGKEATVYCCRKGTSLKVDTEFVAAKLYRSRENRSFRNDAQYWEGSLVAGVSRRRSNDSGARVSRAFANKSKFGLQVQAGTWVHREFETLGMLYDAGADVPRPFQLVGNALLMEFVGDAEGPGIPLIKAQLTREEARPLLERLLDDIRIWLKNNRVHGDLSPYNILFHQGRLTTIDFPQAVDPRSNRKAQELLFRDIGNVFTHFVSYGVKDESGKYASDLWRRFLYSDW